MVTKNTNIRHRKNFFSSMKMLLAYAAFLILFTLLLALWKLLTSERRRLSTITTISNSRLLDSQFEGSASLNPNIHSPQQIAPTSHTVEENVVSVEEMSSTNPQSA